MKGTGMLVVSLRGVNFGFWSRLGYFGQNVSVFSVFFLARPLFSLAPSYRDLEQVTFRVAREEITKKKEFFTRTKNIYSIHINKVLHNINILSPL